MKNQSTLTLSALPQDSLRALQRAVAQRFDWRMMTGRQDDQPRFVIEKRVRYDFFRGLPTYALYHISGSFQQTQSGQTVLQYVVSGQSTVPLFQAALNIGILLVMTVLLGSVVFSPSLGGNWIGILLLGVLMMTMLGYGWYAYRSYQGNLRELNRFMEEFAQGMGGQPKTLA
jgi:hypothetical protein